MELILLLLVCYLPAPKPILPCNHNRSIFVYFALGSTLSKYKGWVGIPLNYLYTSKDDIDYANFRSNHSEQPINWGSDEGQKLADSLILTENEQKFALARAALELKNFNYIHGSILPAFAITALCGASQLANKRFKLLARPLQVSFIYWHFKCAHFI